MNDSNDEVDIAEPICIYPFEAQRALIAASFAKRICAGMATESETEFMCKFMDEDIDGEWFDDADSYADAIKCLTSAV